MLGCGGGAGGKTRGTGRTLSAAPLDMNDVTILAPLPPSTATPVLTEIDQRYPAP